MRRNAIKFLAALGAITLLAGCGFQLRGHALLPFDAAYVDAPNSSTLGNQLRQSLRGQDKLAETRGAAPVLIRLSGETLSKSILSLSGSGKVREYRLEYRVDLAAIDAAGTELLAPSQIHLTREFSYNDDQVLAKESEEAALNRNMEQDALRQILRRLSYVPYRAPAPSAGGSAAAPTR